ncbi:MAG: SH3 domain-containing protein, partial [Phycisphaerae bacterium]
MSTSHAMTQGGRTCAACTRYLAALLLGVPLSVLWQPTRSTVAAQVPAKTVIGRAEVTAADVYVRSGPSANHYPVDKVKAGARVTVVGQMGDWLEILPIDTAYSFIS